jgi:hypothetical protein
MAIAIILFITKQIKKKDDGNNVIVFIATKQVLKKMTIVAIIIFVTKQIIKKR